MGMFAFRYDAARVDGLLARLDAYAGGRLEASVDARMLEVIAELDRKIKKQAEKPHQRVRHVASRSTSGLRAVWTVTPPSAHTITPSRARYLHFTGSDGTDVFTTRVNWQPKNPPQQDRYRPAVEEAQIYARASLERFGRDLEVGFL